MTECNNEQQILESLAPDLLKEYVDINGLRQLFLIKKDRKRSIEEMEIHLENVRKNGGDILGYSSLEGNIKKDKQEYVYILSGYDRKYGFDLYLDANKNRVLGVAIVKLRKKSEDEIKWEKEKLGIKHP